MRRKEVNKEGSEGSLRGKEGSLRRKEGRMDGSKEIRKKRKEGKKVL